MQENPQARSPREGPGWAGLALSCFDLDGGMQEMTLEANPRTSKARLWVGNTYKGEWTLPRIGYGPNSDAYATFGTFFGSAVIDDAYIEQCAP